MVIFYCFKRGCVINLVYRMLESPGVRHKCDIGMDVYTLLQLKQFDANQVVIEATVPTGLESVAMFECKEKFGEQSDVCKDRGRIFFSIACSEITKLFSMRSVDNLYLITHSVKNVGISTGVMDDDLQAIKNLALSPDWKGALSIWGKISNFLGICYPTREQYEQALEEEAHIKNKIAGLLNGTESEKEVNSSDNSKICAHSVSEDESLSDVENTSQDKKSTWSSKAESRKCYKSVDSRCDSSKVLKYRVTCNRVGKHSFGSQDAAYHFGGTLHDMFSWIVDLVHFDLEILLNIKNEDAYIGIALTRESMHRRNIKKFGPTTLRATVCYGMLQLGEPKPGDIIIDPMCGGGSIPIEGALSFPLAFYMGGDVHAKAVDRSLVNVNSLTCDRKKHIDVLAWNVKNLPLKDSSVDIFVTDLPFGKRSGSKQDNRTLYKDALVELARVVRQDSGRAVLLTHDRKNFTRTLTQTHKLWTLAKIVGVNIGGLDAAVYVLNRTNNEAFSIYSYISKVVMYKKKKVS